MNFQNRFRCLALLALCLGCAQMVFAQGTDLGTIRGLVTDPSGAVIPNAKVAIVDLGTNTSRETATNARGEYQMFGLRSGSYKVTVSAPGWTTQDVTGVVLNGSDVVSANATLRVAGTQQAVVVTAEAPTINTEDQTISDTITSKAVIDLPRDSRNVYSFLYLNPNITQAGTDGSFKFLGAQSYGASFSLDGQRSNGGIFGEPTSSQPSLEAVDDINVLSQDFSAEYAGIANIRVTTKRGGSGYHGSLFYNNKNSALAAWTVQDKIGQFNFAPTPFQSKYPNPFFNITDLGASIGGPIPKLGKTWFFAAYERDWTVSPVNVASSLLPHPTLWTGDFSLVDDSAKPTVPSDILAMMTAQEIATNTVGGLGQQFIQIPSRFLNPTVQNLINTYFPKIGITAPIDSSTGQVPDYQTLLSGRSVQDLGTLRVDHDFSEKDHFYITYNAAGQTIANTQVQAPYTGLGLTQNDRRNDTISASYTRVISNNLVNEVRGGLNFQKLRRHSNTTLGTFLSSIGFDQSDIDAYAAVVGAPELQTHGHPAISFSGAFATFQNGGRNTDRPLDQNLFTFGDTLTWVFGKHNFKMGADFVRNAAVDGFAVNRGNPRGLINYTGGNTDPFANFLLGEPATSVLYINAPRPPMDVYNWEQGYFFQDDWKVNTRLTLNLGLRYELVTPFIENNDLLTNFDPNYVDPTTGVRGRFIVPSDKTLPFLDTRILTLLPVVTASQSGLGIGRGLVRTDKNNFAPRIGFALRLGDKSVVRGGYGFYFPTSAAQGIRDPIATNPFNQSLTKKAGTDPNTGDPLPLLGWPGFQHGFSPFTGGVVTKGFNGLPSINAVPFGLQQPRIQQYNATYEREIARDSSIRFSYLGSTLSGLIGGVDLNEIPPSDVPFGTTTGDGTTPCDPILNGDCDFSPADLARQPFPGLGDFLASYGNFGHGRTNAFQTQFEHRYSHGLLLNLSYTLLDQKSTGLDTGNSSLGGIVYNAFQPNHDYGQESFISRNRFVAYGVYDLPVGHGRQFGSSMSGWANAILGGWQTSFNMFAKSGTGFTPFWICDNCGPEAPGNIGVTSLDAVGDFNANSYRGVVTGNFNQRNGNQIWNPDAFALPSTGADVFDNPQVAKRNLLHGPGTWGVNLGVHKDFRFGDRLTATLGADIDNLFNHPLFSPDSDYGGGGGPFSLLGDFSVSVDPNTLKVFIDPNNVNRNTDFGKLINTFTQEGVDSRRTVRLRLRITF
ncbi:MAG TPA: carboxypeptidase regulatory-like domain-containing protein [Terriglobales bacterium]|nr:carboxypeptidase regulatory-like domain-containing protein [Terriglobales bacterium]